MAKILVTGGAGFIGSNFVHYWRATYPEDKIVVLDALTYAGNKANISTLLEQPGFVFVKGSICDTSLLRQLLVSEKLDTIIHLAAESHVDRSITGPDAFIETNIVGTHALLKAAKEIWLDGDKKQKHHFHHVSTDEVHGALGATGRFDENSQYAPNSPSAASKAAADHFVRAAYKTYGLPVLTTNGSNNYG
ncbi:GDP-mannose 4,6-dehydratase, partial [candidate division KSB1 bacterium]|nr:GDP-mannose 4,6-dehydratase [candidate division KSB1 bacterium]